MSKVVLLMKDSISSYTGWCQRIGAFVTSPSKAQGQLALLMLGLMLITFGTGMEATADRTINYNSQRVVEATNGVLLYLEGSFGALVMVASGIGAILSSAFGQYRAALGLMVVAIGAFILRSLMSTFFNDQGISE